MTKRKLLLPLCVLLVLAAIAAAAVVLRTPQPETLCLTPWLRVYPEGEPVTATLVNNGPEAVTVGETILIEQLVDGKWQFLDRRVNESHQVAGRDTKGFLLVWYEHTVAGSYRATLEVDGAPISCEFRIDPDWDSLPLTELLPLSPYAEESFSDFPVALTIGDTEEETEYVRGIGYTLTNNSSQDIFFGDACVIEVKRLGRWYRTMVPDSVAVVMRLTPGESMEMNTHLKKRLFNERTSLHWPAGQYRLVKHINCTDGSVARVKVAFSLGE